MQDYVVSKKAYSGPVTRFLVFSISVMLHVMAYVFFIDPAEVERALQKFFPFYASGRVVEGFRRGKGLGTPTGKQSGQVAKL